MYKKILVPAVIVIIAVLSGCFSPWEGDRATITINLGGGNGSRAVSNETLDMLEHTIVLTLVGSTEPIPIEHTGAGTKTVAVAPGFYNITVTAKLNGKLFAEGSTEESVEVKAGQNNVVTITMTLWVEPEVEVPEEEEPEEEPALDPTKIWLFIEGEEPEEYDVLADALGKIGDGYEAGDFTISIGTRSDNLDLYLNEDSGGSLPEGLNITITSHGSGKVAVELNLDGYLFSVPSGTSLTLEGNITFKGRDDNNSPLIMVRGGILNIKDNVVISGNTNSIGNGSGVYVTFSGEVNMMGGSISNNKNTFAYEGSGGGVYIDESGTFNMHDGATISENYALFYGGGVFVASDGTFNMDGGTISGNQAGQTGGGVYADNNGAFHKTGGTIYGEKDKNDNEEDESLQNKDEYGAFAVYLGGPPADYIRNTVGPDEEIHHPLN